MSKGTKNGKTGTLAARTEAVEYLNSFTGSLNCPGVT
jgi:hypothetical protein